MVMLFNVRTEATLQELSYFPSLLLHNLNLKCGYSYPCFQECYFSNCSLFIGP